MPPAKKKKTQLKKSSKKSRSSSTKKKKGKVTAVDKAWKTSIKFETKDTSEDSRSNTPSRSDTSGKSRNGSMTSRDFIRQVLEFDKAPESELDSSDEEDDEEPSSDVDLKLAIKDSLARTKISGSAGPTGFDDDSDTENDSLLLRDDEEAPSLLADASGDKEGGDSTNDSSVSIPPSSMSADMLMLSVYAPKSESVPIDMPKLNLPESSDDLLIGKEHVLKATGIYEVLRIYGQIVRLSPFIFEEFVAAVADCEPFEYNPLLHEVHSCLMKTLLREEDNNQTSFGPVDLKDSMNSLFFFNDAMTYPHVIREYLRSDMDKEFRAALQLISDPEYPNVSVGKKLSVLETLCNMVIASNSIREELSSDGFIKYDDHCRVCQK